MGSGGEEDTRTYNFARSETSSTKTTYTWRGEINQRGIALHENADAAGLVRRKTVFKNSTPTRSRRSCSPSAVFEDCNLLQERLLGNNFFFFFHFGAEVRKDDAACIYVCMYARTIMQVWRRSTFEPINVPTRIVQATTDTSSRSMKDAI